MDAKRFDELVREHLPHVHRLAIRLCGSVGPAEDVAQDALLRAARGWQTFRGDASFRTWIFRLTVNAWHDQGRQRRHRPDAEPLAGGDDGPPDPRGGGGGTGGNGGPVALAEGRELAALVAARVSALPPRQREVLVLIAYEHHSTAEAAAVLETTEQNVRTTLHLARAKLRADLAEYLNPSADPRSAARRT